MRSCAGTATGPWGASSSDRKVLERVAKHNVTAGVIIQRGKTAKQHGMPNAMAIQFRIRSSVESQGTATNTPRPTLTAQAQLEGGCEANNGDSSHRYGRDMSGGAEIDKSQSVPSDGGNGCQALEPVVVIARRDGW